MIMKYKKDKTYYVGIRLSEADLSLIDELARQKKRTRSEILRLIIQRGVNDGKEAKIAI